jgi:hypothetical protein
MKRGHEMIVAVERKKDDQKDIQMFFLREKENQKQIGF